VVVAINHPRAPIGAFLAILLRCSVTADKILPCRFCALAILRRVVQRTRASPVGAFTGRPVWIFLRKTATQTVCCAGDTLVNKLIPVDREYGSGTAMRRECRREHRPRKGSSAFRLPSRTKPRNRARASTIASFSRSCLSHLRPYDKGLDGWSHCYRSESAGVTRSPITVIAPTTKLFIETRTAAMPISALSRLQKRKVLLGRSNSRSARLRSRLAMGVHSQGRETFAGGPPRLGYLHGARVTPPRHSVRVDRRQCQDADHTAKRQREMIRRDQFPANAQLARGGTKIPARARAKNEERKTDE